VRHDDGAHDPHGLLQLRRAAVLAVRDEEPLQQLLLAGSYCDVLGTGAKEAGGWGGLAATRVARSLRLPD